MIDPLFATQISGAILGFSMLLGLLTFGQLAKHEPEAQRQSAIVQAAINRSKLARRVGVALMVVAAVFLVASRDWVSPTFNVLASIGLCVSAYSSIQAGNTVWSGLAERGHEITAAKRKAILEALGLLAFGAVIIWMGWI